MQVVFNIEAGQLGETVLEVFKNLTEEKKQELALELMKSWLKEPHELERKVYEEQKVEYFRRYKNESNRNYKDMPYEKIIEDWYFKDAMKDFKSSKEIMVETIVAAAKKSFQGHVDKYVAEDEQLAKIRGVVTEELKVEYPAIILEALTRSVSQAFSSMIDVGARNQSQLMMHDSMLNNIRQKLGV